MGKILIPLHQGQDDEMDRRELRSTRCAGEDEQLTFNPGRPISPWRRTNGGAGDGVLVRAEKSTRTHKNTNAFTENCIRDIIHSPPPLKQNPQNTHTHTPSLPLVLLCRAIHYDPEKCHQIYINLTYPIMSMVHL